MRPVLSFAVSHSFRSAGTFTSMRGMMLKPDGEQIALPAIFKQDGDKLKVCWKSIEVKEAPAELSAKSGSGQSLVTLARQKSCDK